jgi:hypothetical protein
MTHPDDLLADYVDGTLSGEELRRVGRHLASCARCASEVALAGGARTALASLVEPPVPARVGGAAIEEAGREAGESTVAGIRSRRPTAPGWHRWALGAAAAAALLVIVFALPNLGSGPGGRRAAAPGAESAANDRTKRADTVEIEHRNYDTDDVAALALSYRSATPVPDASRPSSADGAVGQEAPAAFSAELTPDALTCISNAVPNTDGELVRLIRARFEGTRAFIGVYLEGPGAGQPPDTVRVWVVAEDGCAILTATRASI